MGLTEINGTTFVDTMSIEAMDMYSEAFAYLAEAGNFSAYNS
jgi:hypothetical protein